jgi:hypothetical protein
MPTDNNNEHPKFTVPAGVALKDATVNVLDINPLLQAYLVNAGLIHLHLFRDLLVVTSGKDGVHSPGSKHMKGDAVDLRISTMQPERQPVFLMATRILCERYNLAMFDESYTPGAGHVHIEIAG